MRSLCQNPARRLRATRRRTVASDRTRRSSSGHYRVATDCLLDVLRIICLKRARSPSARNAARESSHFVQRTKAGATRLSGASDWSFGGQEIPPVDVFQEVFVDIEADIVRELAAKKNSPARIDWAGSSAPTMTLPVCCESAGSTMTWRQRLLAF